MGKKKEWIERSGRALTTIAIMVLGVALCVALAFTFREYRGLIIKEQEDQLLTISKAVSNSISLYTDFYFMDLKDVDAAAQYREAGQKIVKDRDAADMETILSAHMSLQNGDVDNLLLIDRSQENERYHILAKGLGEKEYILVNRLGDEKKERQMDILKGSDGRFYLGLSIPSVSEDQRLVFVINIEDMYQKVASYIKVGENGYVMIKDSTGLILMHPVEAQIGRDVIEDRGEMYPGYDLSELETLVEHQKQGKEAVEIYHSYWWADQVPSRVMKIAAYTPLWFQDDFLIVSAVIDYGEIATPVRRAMASVSLLSIFLVAVSVLLFFRLRVSATEKRKMEKENQYLRSLNSKLEELRGKEERMAHDQRLQMIGTLTGGIAHEFNNLLTPIMGYSGLIMADAQEESDGQLYENASEIYSSAEKAKEIIRQIAFLSRKQKDVRIRPLNVSEAAVRALKMIGTVKPSNIEIRTDFQWDDSCFILCSETEFSQIILNLCTNAFYAMKEQKGLLKLTGRADSALITLTVEDNGRGMEKEVVTHIFDPFYTTKQAGEGTGLGLSTVQGILRSLNGTIEVLSAPAEGSCFTIRIPLYDGEKAQEPGQTSSDTLNQDRSKKKILLVEDDKKILKMFEKSLLSAGFQVKAIGNPLEALNCLKAERYDVVVTDYAMPEMTGAKIALQVKSMGLDSRVILVTGFVEDEVIEYHQKQIIHAVLLKPLDGKSLVDAIALQI